MRNRAFVIATLLSLPVALTAQGIRLPRGGGRAGPSTAAPLPPEAPIVSQALSYKRSRWSVETYSLLSAVQVPSIGGSGTSRYTNAGGGSHADYRATEHFSGTVDLTSTLPIGSSNSQTVELGSRFSPLSWNQRLRPFVDARAVYARLTDTFTGPESSPTAIIGGSPDAVAPGSRYSRGVGGLGGAGLEYSLTSRFALTSEFSALRTRMTTYRLASFGTGPVGASSFTMSSYRVTLGLKFNPVSALHMTQKAAP